MILKLKEITFRVKTNCVPVIIVKAFPVKSAGELVWIPCLKAIEELQRINICEILVC